MVWKHVGFAFAFAAFLGIICEIRCPECSRQEAVVGFCQLCHRIITFQAMRHLLHAVPVSVAPGVDPAVSLPADKRSARTQLRDPADSLPPAHQSIGFKVEQHVMSIR